MLAHTFIMCVLGKKHKKENNVELRKLYALMIEKGRNIISIINKSYYYANKLLTCLQLSPIH